MKPSRRLRLARPPAIDPANLATLNHHARTVYREIAAGRCRAALSVLRYNDGTVATLASGDLDHAVRRGMVAILEDDVRRSAAKA